MAASMMYMILVATLTLIRSQSIPAPTISPTATTGSPTRRPTLQSIPVSIEMGSSGVVSSTGKPVTLYWTEQGKIGNSYGIRAVDDITTVPYTFLLETYPKTDGEDQIVKFHSSNKPNHYVRHYCFRMFIDEYPTSGDIDLFEKDSQFYVSTALNKKSDHVSFRSVNYPTFYIAGDPNSLEIYDESELDTDEKKNRASFRAFCQDCSNCPALESSTPSDGWLYGIC